MPLAKEIAKELRVLADALDREPEQELVVADVDFRCKYRGDKGKESFLALARILPRPLAKGLQEYDKEALELKYKTDALIVTTNIERSKVCKLIEPARTIPAVYECEPLLSADEEAAVGA